MVFFHLVRRPNEVDRSTYLDPVVKQAVSVIKRQRDTQSFEHVLGIRLATVINTLKHTAPMLSWKRRTCVFQVGFNKDPGAKCTFCWNILDQHPLFREAPLEQCCAWDQSVCLLQLKLIGAPGRSVG